ncbi:MAG: hypothetical protein ACP5IT_12425 [Thermoproteota archaeon]
MKFVHQIEKPREKSHPSREFAYLECEDWLPEVVSYLNEMYDIEIPITPEEGEEPFYAPGRFTYECYDTDKGYIKVWTNWYNIGEVWSKKFEGLAGEAEVIKTDSTVEIPDEDIISFAEEVIDKIRDYFREYGEELFSVVDRRTKEAVTAL